MLALFISILALFEPPIWTQSETQLPWPKPRSNRPRPVSHLPSLISTVDLPDQRSPFPFPFLIPHYPLTLIISRLKPPLNSPSPNYLSISFRNPSRHLQSPPKIDHIQGFQSHWWLVSTSYDSCMLDYHGLKARPWRNLVQTSDVFSAMAVSGHPRPCSGRLWLFKPDLDLSCLDRWFPSLSHPLGFFWNPNLRGSSDSFRSVVDLCSLQTFWKFS